MSKEGNVFEQTLLALSAARETSSYACTVSCREGLSSGVRGHGTARALPVDYDILRLLGPAKPTAAMRGRFGTIASARWRTVSSEEESSEDAKVSCQGIYMGDAADACDGSVTNDAANADLAVQHVLAVWTHAGEEGHAAGNSKGLPQRAQCRPALSKRDRRKARRQQARNREQEDLALSTDVVQAAAMEQAHASFFIGDAAVMASVTDAAEAVAVTDASEAVATEQAPEYFFIGDEKAGGPPQSLGRLRAQGFYEADKVSYAQFAGLKAGWGSSWALLS